VTAGGGAKEDGRARGGGETQVTQDQGYQPDGGAGEGIAAADLRLQDG